MLKIAIASVAKTFILTHLYYAIHDRGFLLQCSSCRLVTDPTIYVNDAAELHPSFKNVTIHELAPHDLGSPLASHTRFHAGTLLAAQWIMLSHGSGSVIDTQLD